MFKVLDHLSITCLSSPNQQYDQLVFSCRFKCITTQLSILDVPLTFLNMFFAKALVSKTTQPRETKGSGNEEADVFSYPVPCLTLPNPLKIEFLSAKCSCPGFSRVEIRLRRPNVERHYNYKDHGSTSLVNPLL